MTTANTNNLIKIETNQEGVQAVSARELYTFLGLRQKDFARWCKQNITDNAFAIETDDYMRVRIDAETPTGGKIAREDYILSIDFAKKLCMLSRTKKGDDARDYFLQCERQLQLANADSYMIDDPVLRAQRWIEEEQERRRLAQIAVQLEAAQPLIDFAEMILDAGDTMDMQQVASIIAQRGYGRTNLFRLLKAEGVLINSKRPYQRQVDAGRFRVVERPFRIAERDEVRISRKIVVTQKGLQYIQQLVNTDIRRRNEERASRGA